MWRHSQRAVLPPAPRQRPRFTLIYPTTWEWRAARCRPPVGCGHPGAAAGSTAAGPVAQGLGDVRAGGEANASPSDGRPAASVLASCISSAICELAALGGDGGRRSVRHHLYDYAAAEAAYRWRRAVEPGFTSKWRLMYARARAHQQDGHGDAARGGLKLSWASSAPCAARRCRAHAGCAGAVGSPAVVHARKDEHENPRMTQWAWCWASWSRWRGGGRPAFNEGIPNDTRFASADGKPLWVGLNYFDPETAGRPRSAAVRRGSRQRSSSGWVAQQGFTTIASSSRDFVEQSPQLTKEGADKFRRLIELCRERTITSFRPSELWEGARLVQGDRFAVTRCSSVGGLVEGICRAFRMIGDLRRPGQRADGGVTSPAKQPKWNRWLQDRTAAWRGTRRQEVPPRQGGSARPDRPANHPAAATSSCSITSVSAAHRGQWKSV